MTDEEPIAPLKLRNVKHMKTKSRDEKVEELRHEYDLAALLKNGVQGKYAKRYEQGTNLVLLSPDVAKDFPTDEAVNYHHRSKKRPPT
jgi:hypothetical protein